MTNAPIPIGLAVALGDWRKLERHHALVVLGEASGHPDHLQDKADRALQTVRVEADKWIASIES